MQPAATGRLVAERCSPAAKVLVGSRPIALFFATTGQGRLTPATSNTRLRSLDGLRGIASVVVVLHHVALSQRNFASAYLKQELPEPGSLGWWLFSSPFRVASLGSEAVIVFFVLSGFVVSLPAIRNRSSFDWLQYYISRCLRLWIPVAVSVLLASMWVSFNAQAPYEGMSIWTKTSATDQFDLSTVIRSLDALRGPTNLNNPLWSIQVEILFSLLLPLLVSAAVAVKKRPITVLILCLLLEFLGHLNSSGSLTYLPVFLVGAVMAARMSTMRTLISTLNAKPWSGALWLGIFSLSIVLLCSNAIYLSGNYRDPFLLWLSETTVTVGAVGMTIVAMGSPLIRGVLESKAPQWLGRISFSLYLVHVPLILFLSYLLGPHVSWGVVALVSIPSSFLLATIFQLLVEMPSHRFSKRVGQAASLAAARSSRNDDVDPDFHN